MAAVLLALASAVSLLAQMSAMAGSITEGLKAESLAAVITGMDLGKAAVIRTLAALAALAAILRLKRRRAGWVVAALLGAVATASFAWSGHVAANETTGKAVHLLADVAHGWAAAVWMGSLAGFFLLLRPHASQREDVAALHSALHGFAGVGAVLVAVLIATGFVNSWFLVGPDHLSGLWTTAYGRLLCLKILLFVGMLGLAVANRFRLTPGLRRAIASHEEPVGALGALRLSVLVETVVGVLVLALVAWLGTLAPPSSL